jgi:hypothetical protein
VKASAKEALELVGQWNRRVVFLCLVTLPLSSRTQASDPSAAMQAYALEFLMLLDKADYDSAWVVANNMNGSVGREEWLFAVRRSAGLRSVSNPKSRRLETNHHNSRLTFVSEYGPLREVLRETVVIELLRDGSMKIASYGASVSSR